MSTVGSTGAISSTAQQDRVASGNSQQARRSSGDSRVFANMLAAAADQATPETLAENTEQARKKDAGRQGDLDVDTALGRSAGQPADSGSLTRPLGAADTQATPDKQPASEEAGQPTRRATPGGRSWSTLALVGRDVAAAQRATSAASNAAEVAIPTSATATTATTGTWAAGLNPAADAAQAPAAKLADSQGAAFAAALEDALDVSDDVTLTATISTDLQGSGSDGPDAAVGALAQAESRDSEALTGTEVPPETAADAAAAFQNTWNDAMERVGQQVSYWLGKGVSQAQLTVHGGQGESVDVRVLLRDGQAHLEFLSNSEATREAIAQHGADVLRGVLGESGLDLASLRVDLRDQNGQGTGQSPGHNGGDPTRRLDEASALRNQRDEGAEPTRPASVTAQSTGWTTTALLDTFA